MRNRSICANPIARAAALAAVAAAMLGCGALNMDETDQALAKVQQADFSSAGGLEDNRLARPPNVISDVDRTLLRIENEGASRLLPTVSQARLRRDGDSFWLEVDLEPEVVWQTLRDFWTSEGFELDIEIPEAGVIETDWRQDRSRILGIGLSRYLDLALERVNDTGERYKFRSRIERGERPGTTLVFISYRAVQEVAQAIGYGFEPLPKDPTLEAEMLRRLMLRFRLDEESIARVEDFEQSAERSDIYQLESGTLTILRGREQAWLALLQALDRSGYNLVATDKDAGSVTIRTADPNIGEEDLGFFENLLGSDPEGGEPFEATISIQPEGADRTKVVVPEGELGETIIDILVANL